MEESLLSQITKCIQLSITLNKIIHTLIIKFIQLQAIITCLPSLTSYFLLLFF